VVGPRDFAELERLSERRTGVAAALAELHELCVHEGYELVAPERLDRPVPFGE
jgi:hypothetical protein